MEIIGRTQKGVFLMKNKFSLRLVALLLMAALLLPVCAFADNATHYYVNTSNKKPLNMRAGMTTRDIVITTIPYGAEVNMIGISDENPAWAAVSYGDYNGYVMVRYLSTRQPAPESTETERLDKENKHYNYFKQADYYATVTPSTPTGFVNMRWAPSTDNAVHAKYHQGDVLRVIAETDAWAQVLDEETMTCGFMLKRFLH